MRVFVILIGIALAATGGVVAYRAAFVEPHGVVVISETAGRVRELPDMLRLAGGLVLLFVGVGCASASASALKRGRYPLTNFRPLSYSLTLRFTRIVKSL
jgi:hypothetical protein